MLYLLRCNKQSTSKILVLSGLIALWSLSSIHAEPGKVSITDQKANVSQLPNLAQFPTGSNQPIAQPYIEKEPAESSSGLSAQQHAQVNPAFPQAHVSSGLDEYWVVSTRHLSHDLTGCPCQKSYCYFRGGCCGSVTKSNSIQFANFLVPGEPIFVMAHGSFVDWNLALHDAKCTFNWIRKYSCGKPVRMVFVTWPADGPETLLPAINVNVSGRRAAYDGIYLSGLIDTFPAVSPVCLLGHSHGARVISACLHYRAGGEIFGCCRKPAPCRKMRAIFAAGAIDHCWLNPRNRYGGALTQVQCLVNLRNRRDGALLFYPLARPFSGAAIARKGFSRRDNAKIGWQSQKIIEHDVTVDLQLRHTWPNYYNNPYIGKLLSHYIYNW